MTIKVEFHRQNSQWRKKHKTQKVACAIKGLSIKRLLYELAIYKLAIYKKAIY